VQRVLAVGAGLAVLLPALAVVAMVGGLASLAGGGCPGAATLVASGPVSASDVPSALLALYAARSAITGSAPTAGRSWRRSTTSSPTSGRISRPARPGRSGWMQFKPSTWATYRVTPSGAPAPDDSSGWNDPADAIYTTARYLQANGRARRLERRRLQPRRLVCQRGRQRRRPLPVRDRRPGDRRRQRHHHQQRRERGHDRRRSAATENPPTVRGRRQRPDRAGRSRPDPGRRNGGDPSGRAAAGAAGDRSRRPDHRHLLQPGAPGQHAHPGPSRLPALAVRQRKRADHQRPNQQAAREPPGKHRASRQRSDACVRRSDRWQCNTPPGPAGRRWR